MDTAMKRRMLQQYNRGNLIPNPLQAGLRPSTTEVAMRVITVLNRCTKFKRFVFSKCSFSDDGKILVETRPRNNSKARCSGCGQPAPTYDTAPEPRHFEFIPTWGFAVHLVYRMRRVLCPASLSEWGTKLATNTPVFFPAFARLIAANSMGMLS